MTLQTLSYELTVCKVGATVDIDFGKDFYFVAKTEEEFSLVCKTEDTPARTIAREDGWRGFYIQGELDFSLIGILAKLCEILAKHHISIFAVSTYNTDYILVQKENFNTAMAVLAAAGYHVVSCKPIARPAMNG